MRLVCSSNSAQYGAQCVCVEDNCSHYALCTLCRHKSVQRVEMSRILPLLSMVLSVCVEDNCSQHSNSHSLLTPTYPLCDTQNLMPTIPSLSPPAITVILLHSLPPKLRSAISRRHDVSAKYTRRLLKEDIGCFSADSDKRGPLSGYMGSTLYVSSKCPFWVAS